jgi:hypothetical protein
MDRRNLGAGLMVLASSFMLMVGSASAHGNATPQGTAPPASCKIKSQTSFVLQGEFNQSASAADVIEVSCDPNTYSTGSKVTVIASQLYSRCNGEVSWYVPNPYEVTKDSRSVVLTLDADGNANVGLIAGPNCHPGTETLISVHENEWPYETSTTAFTLLPPKATKPGLFALPAAQVEDAQSSGVVTIIEAEFARASEKSVRVASEELYGRCEVYPHLHWISESGHEVSNTSELTGEDAIKLDNNGNGFVLVVGDSSCAEGASLIEGDLESNPYTTYTTNFTVVEPMQRF